MYVKLLKQVVQKVTYHVCDMFPFTLLRSSNTPSYINVKHPFEKEKQYTYMKILRGRSQDKTSYEI